MLPVHWHGDHKGLVGSSPSRQYRHVGDSAAIWFGQERCAIKKYGAGNPFLFFLLPCALHLKKSPLYWPTLSLYSSCQGEINTWSPPPNPPRPVFLVLNRLFSLGPCGMERNGNQPLHNPFPTVMPFPVNTSRATGSNSNLQSQCPYAPRNCSLKTPKRLRNVSTEYKKLQSKKRCAPVFGRPGILSVACDFLYCSL
jgi:hypothetical protein